MSIRPALMAAICLLTPLAAMGQVTRANCPSNPLCRIVSDADRDGEISDDLRRARNELLYASGATPQDTVYLFSPDPGTYRWSGEVRFCGDDVAPPTGEDEPDCDGTSAIPTVRFKGNWETVAVDADCSPNLEPDVGMVQSCLHIGDRWNGGALEPRPRVIFDSTMRFRYVAMVETTYLIFSRVHAIWLDGVDQSIVSAKVSGEFSGTPETHAAGGAIYASATNSTIVARLVPGSTHVPPEYGVVADGVMSGSQILVYSDFSSVRERPFNALMIGEGSSFFSQNDFNDGCGYGPGLDLDAKVDPVGSCTDFTAYVFFRCQTTQIGMEPVMVMDGDGITLDLDVVDNEYQHIAVKLDVSDTPGEVGDVTITGSVAGHNKTVIAANGTTDLFLDATVQNLDGNKCYSYASTATVTEGPDYVCIP